ncbi:hypothetical protein ELR70_00920 [Pseudoalteromonas sp. R3]|nr:hypothetical protein ELR70_00920 [Pseudoalteromonas sp. R3]
MKLKLQKTKIKNLSSTQAVDSKATPMIAGGGPRPTTDIETRFDRGCPFFTDWYANTCGMGWTCRGVN